MTPQLDRYGRKAWNLSYMSIWILISKLSPTSPSLSKKDYANPHPLHGWAHMDFSIQSHQLLNMEVLPKKARPTAVTWIRLLGRDTALQTSSWQPYHVELWLFESSAPLFLIRKVQKSLNMGITNFFRGILILLSSTSQVYHKQFHQGLTCTLNLLQNFSSGLLVFIITPSKCMCFSNIQDNCRQILAEAWSSTEPAGGRTIAQLQFKFKHEVGLNTVRENFAASWG